MGRRTVRRRTTIVVIIIAMGIRSRSYPRSNGWHRNGTSIPPGSSNDMHPLILRSCVLELVVDYCSRVTTRVTNEYIRELNAIPESDPFPTLDEIEKRLLDDVKDMEG